MRKESRAARGELAVVLAFALLAAFPFVFKPLHIDEPYFLAVARQTLKDPLHPTAFVFNAHGRSESMEGQHNNPPLLPLLEAGALALAGERPWLLRLLFLPFDLLAAAAIYLLAARFLRRPLWPTLLALASPAYFINMQHLMAEKVSVPLGLWGLYSLARGLEDAAPLWIDLSALSLAGAMLAKYNAIWFALVAMAYAARRGLTPARLARFAALATLPAALYGASRLLGRPLGSDPVMKTLLAASAAPWSGPLSRLRALGAFVGGCSATSLWAAPLMKPKGSRRAALALAAAALLFSPLFDFEAVKLVDRLLGGLWFAAAALSASSLLTQPGRGKELWTIWFLGGVAATFTYWSVTTRVALIAIIPLTLGLAAALEARVADGGGLYPWSFAAMLACTAALSWVDLRYALVQKRQAEREASSRPAGTLWFTGHWGLQYYMEREGARALDDSMGGWGAVRPGDRVVVPSVNANILHPRAPLLADVRRITVDEPLPLRLIAGPGGQAGFYSSAFGFLPYALSRDPLEQFDDVEPR